MPWYCLAKVVFPGCQSRLRYQVSSPSVGAKGAVSEHYHVTECNVIDMARRKERRTSLRPSGNTKIRASVWSCARGFASWDSKHSFGAPGHSLRQVDGESQGSRSVAAASLVCSFCEQPNLLLSLLHIIVRAPATDWLAVVLYLTSIRLVYTLAGRVARLEHAPRDRFAEVRAHGQ